MPRWEMGPAHVLWGPIVQPDIFSGYWCNGGSGLCSPGTSFETRRHSRGRTSRLKDQSGLRGDTEKIMQHGLELQASGVALQSYECNEQMYFCIVHRALNIPPSFQECKSEQSECSEVKCGEVKHTMMQWITLWCTLWCSAVQYGTVKYKLVQGQTLWCSDLQFDEEKYIIVHWSTLWCSEVNCGAVK